MDAAGELEKDCCKRNCLEDQNRVALCLSEFAVRVLGDEGFDGFETVLAYVTEVLGCGVDELLFSASLVRGCGIRRCVW